MKHRLITLTVIIIAAILFAAQAVQAGELHDAAKAGDLQKVKQLLSSGIDINEKDKSGIIQSGNTPLHDAAYYGRTEVVELLIRKGADVNAKAGLSGETPLFSAANTYNANSIKIVKLLIQKGADIKVNNKFGESLLHATAEKENTGLAKLFIEKGLDVNVKTNHQSTPLHIAAAYGRTKMVKLLILKGAEVNARDERQRTPLFGAAKSGIAENVHILINAGADVNAKDSAGNTAAVAAEKYNNPGLATLIRGLTGGSVRSDLTNLIHELVEKRQIYYDDVALAVRLAQSLSPPPAIPQKAQDEMTKGTAAFKLARQPKDFDKAAKHFEKAALHAPWWPAPYYNLALARESARRFELTNYAYKNYLIASPDAADAQAVKGKIAEMNLRMVRVEQIDEHIKKANQYLDNNNRAGAIEEIRKAVRLEPDDAGNHFMLGHVLAYGGKHHAKEAITELKYAERLGIKIVDLYWDLGNAYENLDEYDATIESYTKALALIIFDKEQKAKIHNNIGLAYEKKRNSKKALEHFKLAQKLGHPRKDYIRKQIRKHKRLLGR